MWKWSDKNRKAEAMENAGEEKKRRKQECKKNLNTSVN